MVPLEVLEVAYHGYDGTPGVTGFPNTGSWLIFGVVLVPIYVMLIAWFAGEPRDTKTGLLGVTYLVGLVTSMWGGMFVMTVILGIVFFGGMPEPLGPTGPP